MKNLVNLSFNQTRRASLAVWLCLCTAACSGLQVDAKAPSEKAERVYFDGMEYLAEGAFLEAQQTFTEALKLPGYLEVTALARLRLGDAYYFQHKFQRAIEQYEAYARRHDGSKNVPYARFMVAKSHFQLIPTEFWLLPPVHEMDLSAADKARYHIENFMRRYPLTSFASEAADLRDRCIDLQVSHHAYVVQFYVGRSKWLGAVFRLHQLMRLFPVRGHTLGNYQTLATAYETLGWRKRGLAIHRAIAQRWPSAASAMTSREKVANLRAAIARLKAEKNPAAEMPLEVPPTAAYHPEEMAAEAAG